MEKIKITKDQEEALKNFGGGFMTTNQKLLNFTSGGALVGGLQSLNDFTPEQFALLLCGWFEVVQPFKVGDWVYIQSWDIYRQVEIIENDRLYYMHDDMLDGDLIGEFEKVEEPWKIMLLELGRDKPEFYINDIIVFDNGEIVMSDWLTDKEIIGRFEKGLVKEFHAYENRIEVKQ